MSKIIYLMVPYDERLRCDCLIGNIGGMGRLVRDLSMVVQLGYLALLDEKMAVPYRLRTNSARSTSPLIPSWRQSIS